MGQLDELCDNLILFRDDLYAHYDEIFAEFEFDREASPANPVVISGEAAFLALMQYYLTTMDRTIDTLEQDGDMWRDLLNLETVEQTVQRFLQQNRNTLSRRCEQDPEFRQECLEVAQRETPYILEEMFFAGFDPVFEWLDAAIEQAPAVIQAHKDARDGKTEKANAPTPSRAPRLN